MLHEVNEERLTVRDDPGWPDQGSPVMKQVLRPYRDNCRYLQRAQVYLDSDDNLACDARFAIGESAYIDDTGHFNAVEFNICFNQIGYYLVAMAVAGSLAPPFDEWAMSDFRERQLANILITDYRAVFRRPICSDSFSGRLTFIDITKRESRSSHLPIIVVDSECKFWDESGGNCEGHIVTAITDPRGRRAG